MHPIEVKVHGVGELKALQGSAIIYRKWVDAPRGLDAGTLVKVTGERGLEACGLWEPLGPVAIRIVQHGGCDYRDPRDAIEEGLHRAYRAREAIGYTGYDAYRLVNSDGDLMSGLIVDVYNDVAVVQSSSLALDKHLDTIAYTTASLTGVEHVFNKSTQRSRRDIGLEPREEWIIGRKQETLIEEDGVKFIVDVVHGQKTGFFLDQRVNRLELKRMTGNGDIFLDVFSYTGAFGIHALAQGARKAIFIEEDPRAVRILKRNLKENNMSNYTIINNSIWNIKSIGEKATIASVDPPAFIQEPGEAALAKGIKAYKRAYKWSIGQVDYGGIIYLSSCSYFLDRQRFLQLISRLLAAHRPLYKILGPIRGASPDHVYRGEEYLEYLKGAFVQV